MSLVTPTSHSSTVIVGPSVRSFRTIHRCHNTTPPTPLGARTRYMSGRALEMLLGRPVGHQTQQNRLYRPGAPSSDRHVIATRENLAEWQRSSINITHARTRKNKSDTKGGPKGNIKSKYNGSAISVWFITSIVILLTWVTAQDCPKGGGGEL